MFESRLNSYFFVEYHFIVFVVDRHGPSDDFLSMQIDCISIAILFQTIIILSERKTYFTFSHFVALLSFFRCHSISKITYVCKYFSELPVASPLVYACMRMTETWKEYAIESINSFGQAPDDFIPGCFPNPTASGPAIEKYRCLFEPQNTPFRYYTLYFNEMRVDKSY